MKSTWLSDFWSTFLTFFLVVPNLQIIIMFFIGGFLAVFEGWSFSGGFHYHTFMLGLTHINLGDASPPATTIGLLVNMYATLTGGIATYMALYIAAMTTVTSNIAEVAPDGFPGLLVAIFLYYPPLVACLAHIIGAVMCVIEGWSYIDSFLLACSWLSAVPLRIGGCTLSSQVSLFIASVCKMVAVAMKITVLDMIYFNKFPRKVVKWVDTWVAQEDDGDLDQFQPVCQGDLYKLEEECAALEADIERWQEDNKRLKQWVVALQKQASADGRRAISCCSARGARRKVEALGSEAAESWPATLYGSATVELPVRYPEVRHTYPQSPANAGGLVEDDSLQPS